MCFSMLVNTSKVYFKSKQKIIKTKIVYFKFKLLFWHYYKAHFLNVYLDTVIKVNSQVHLSGHLLH